ncbi:MAG: PorT family protein [Bacteroidetes bacterium]|nr:MAG: PorT family protein [Bacteroidota bacterium]
MKKFGLTCLLISCLGLQLFAQKGFQIGPRIGISTSSIQAGDLLVKDAATLDSLKISAENATVGIRLGLVSRISFNEHIYLQPELILRTSKAEYRWNDLSKGEVRFAEENSLFFDIPVMAGARFGFFRIQAGPMASLHLNTKSDLTDIHGYDRLFNKVEWGLQGGVGFDIWKFILDLNYQLNISEAENGITIGNQSFNLNDEQAKFILGIGFLF